SGCYCFGDNPIVRIPPGEYRGAVSSSRRGVVGAVGAAVVWVRVDDQLDAQASERQREVLGRPGGGARVGQQLADRDAAVVHAPDHGRDLGGRVVFWACDVDAPDQLWNLGAAFVLDGREGLQVVAEEHLALGGVVADAVPPGGLAVGAALL